MFGPRSRISPSSAILIPTPGSGRPAVPFLLRPGRVWAAPGEGGCHGGVEDAVLGPAGRCLLLRGVVDLLEHPRDGEQERGAELREYRGQGRGVPPAAE